MRVLICDDEVMIRKGIKAMVEKKFSGIEVSLCQNGQEALQAIEQQTYDLVITDIQMPEMDGLAFIKKIHSLQVELPIIIISGYDYFEYAIEALRYGVKEYLLKPVERTKLFEAIEKIQDMNEKKVSSPNENGELISKLQVKLVQETRDDLMEYRDIQFIHESFYVTVCRGVSKEVIYKKFEGKKDYFLFARTEDEWIIFSQDKLQCQDIGIIGVSSIKCGHSQIKKGYEEALCAIQGHFFYPEQQLFTYENRTRKEPQIGEELERVIRYIGVNRDEEMISLFEKLLSFETLSTYSLSYTRKMHQKLFELLKEKVVLAFRKEDECINQLEKFEASSSYHEWREIWCKWLIHYSQEIYRKTGAQYYISRSLEYIEQHYNEEITLAMVSNHVSLNYSYLSALFKEHVGKSFGTYVRSLRVEKAKQYLKDEHLKVYEVAELVGYQDAKQFTKTFRKLTGVSPQEYREKNRVLQLL